MAAQFNSSLPSTGINSHCGEKVGPGLYISISADHMECRCSFIPGKGDEEGATVTKFKMKSLLANRGINTGIDWDAVESFISTTKNTPIQATHW